jgi:hypothetical protein
MADYCLKNIDQAEFDGLMLLTGLGVEVTDDEDTTIVVAASPEVLIDRIGPITMGEVTYPEYYSNLRLLFEPTEEQVEALAPFAIDPSQPQYRVWA